MLTVEESVTLYLTQYKDALIRDQQLKRIRASGKSAASLKVVLKKPVGGSLRGASYFQFQFDGRRPGGMPPIEAIQQWLRVRHLNLSPWAVAKSIAKKGTQALHDPARRLNIDQEAQRYKEELLKNLGAAYGVLIVQELKDVTKAI